MRNRSFIAPRVATTYTFTDTLSNPTAWNSFPDSPGYYEGARGPGYASRSTIIDEEARASKWYKVPREVQHTKFSAAGFGGQRINLKYATPLPDAMTSIRLFLDDRAPDSIVFPANDLLDSLASLVSGNERTRLSLPIALIESAQTLAMVRNPFNLLKPDFHKRVRKLTAASLLAKGAGIWLEQLFGWQQFKSDIDETAKVVATVMNSPLTQQFLDQERRMSSSKKDILCSDVMEYNVGTSLATWTAQKASYTWNDGGIGMFRKSNVTKTVTHRLGCVQRSNALNALTYTQRLFQLTGSEVNWYSIRDIMWEVIPFSFVVDWFINTRGFWYIPNFVRLSNMDVKYLCYSTKYSETYNIDWIPCPRMYYYWNATPWGYQIPIGREPDFLHSDSQGSKVTYYRTPGFPVSDGLVTSTLATKGLTWSKLLTGGALFAQRFFN